MVDHPSNSVTVLLWSSTIWHYRRVAGTGAVDYARMY